MLKEQYRTPVKRHDFYPVLFAICFLLAIPACIYVAGRLLG